MYAVATNNKALPEFSESMGETMDKVTERLNNKTTISRASEAQIEEVLLEVTKLVHACMKRRNEVQKHLGFTLDKARARYSSGGTSSALVSMRRVDKLRAELTKLAAKWCKLMEVFVQVQVELEQSPDYAGGDHFVVDLELQELRLAMEEAQEQKYCCVPNMAKGDEELLSEVQELATRSVSN